MKTSWSPEFTKQDYEILDETNVYQVYCSVKKYKLRFRLFDGGWSHPIVRDLVCHSNASAVLLYDPIEDKVVMIEQFRTGALQDPKSPWLLEIVAGVIDPGETPESTAFREAEEEANCKILRLKHIHSYRVSPGISTEYTHVYCGFVKIPEQGGIHGLAEDGEDIKMHIMTRETVLKLLFEGAINNASSVIALQWLALNYRDLQAEFS